MEFSFFGTEEIQSSIKIYLKRLSNFNQPVAEDISTEIDSFKNILQYILDEPIAADKNFTITLSKHQTRIQHLLNNEINNDSVLEIMYIFYMFCLEYKFRHPNHSHSTIDGYYAQIENNKKKFTKYVSNYSKSLGPLRFEVIEDKLEHNQSNHTDDQENIKKQIRDWNLNLKQKQQEIKELEEKLDTLRITGNFELLNVGLEKFISQKKRAQLIALFMIILLATGVLYAPFQAYDSGLFYAPAYLMVELLLIYFFRIVIKSYFSISDQLLQLNNRQALLQFIQPYTDYKIKNKIAYEQIAKFEDIVFSKISPDMEKVPTSPDLISAIEKIANIVKRPSS